MILWLPFGAALFIALAARSKRKLSAWVSILSMVSGFVFSLILLAKCLASGTAPFLLESSARWIALESLKIEFGILINPLSLLMLLIVTGIGSLIFIYSTSYMETDEGYSRYFACLSLFAFSMLGIVLSNNLIQIFIFWELVGLSSYLLIGFWFEKPAAGMAGKKAFMTTRVGDVGMMIGILLLFGALSAKHLATFNFLNLAEALPKAALGNGLLTAAGLLIFMGVMGKSAQMPLHVWLPDAMEGPTPVSALIHAATMVAAGVFLLARLFFVFSASPLTLAVIAWTGAVTAFLAGTIAIVQNDIKKILAYSTLSQLGLMVMALGLGSPEAGMFHLTTHAFFKALLFLGAGSLIHALHTQDIFEMKRPGGLLKKLPVTSLSFIIATLALMGIPPLSGFFSKEEILAAASHGPAPIFWLSLATVLCTSFYMGRLCTVVFMPATKDPHEAGHGHHEPHESGPAMTIPLIILAVFSAVSAFLPIKKLVASHTAAHAVHGPAYLGILSIGLAVLGFLAALFIWRGKNRACETRNAPWPLRVLEHKYFFDDFYDAVVIRGVQENAASFSEIFEKHAVIQGMVHGTAGLAKSAGDALRKLQSGRLQSYALAFSAGATAIIFLILFALKP